MEPAEDNVARREAPTRLEAPMPPMPRSLRRRLRRAERQERWSLSHAASERARYEAATLRWALRNHSQPRTCQCGAPGTVRVVYGGGGYMGSEPPFWWRCEEHADVPLTVPWSGGRPLIGQTREECSWRTAKIGGAVTDCGCGTHVGEDGESS